jgi:anti-anti-sigma regulatory factor
MTIKLDQAQSNPAIMILSIQGDLDASNYKDVIETARQAIDQGGQHMLIDMTELEFMSSSGLIALHSVALLMRGDQPPDPEHGWEAFHALERDRETGLQEKVKLLNPQPKINRSLEITGLKEFFEIYTDLDTAIASFG